MAAGKESSFRIESASVPADAGRAAGPASSRAGEGTSTARFKTCVLHIGTEKTGTTALQNFFMQNWPKLKKAGIYYPIFKEAGSQWEFAAVAHDTPWIHADLKREFELEDAASQERFRDELTEVLEDQFRSAPKCSTLLVSSEHLHSRLATPESVERLKAFLGQWAESFKVIVYFRRQDRVALSLNSTRIKSGIIHGLPVFPYGRKGAPRYYYYDDIYEMWASVFGNENMIARIYEDVEQRDNGLPREVSDLLGLDFDSLQPPDRTVNASLSREAFYFIEEVNRQSPKFIDGTLDIDVDWITRKLSALYPGKHYLVSRKQAEHFAAFFRRRNERLRTLAFPDRPAPLFDTDFSEYPEEAEAAGLTVEEAVGISISLVREIERPNPRPPFWKTFLARWFRSDRA